MSRRLRHGESEFPNRSRGRARSQQIDDRFDNWAPFASQPSVFEADHPANRPGALVTVVAAMVIAATIASICIHC